MRFREGDGAAIVGEARIVVVITLLAMQRGAHLRHLRQLRLRCSFWVLYALALKASLLKLIYLIGKLPTDPMADSGLRATEDSLADLLVTELAGGSSALRKRIPDLLDALHNTQWLVMAIATPSGTEYRLQTAESSAWHDEYRKQVSELSAKLDSNNALRYVAPMIKTFRCRDTEALFLGRRVARFAPFERAALRKLVQLNLARVIDDMRAPPGNRLEGPKG